MPISKSAKKSLRVSETRRAQNYKQKVILEKALRSASEKNISEVISVVDKSAKIKIIAKNKAARIKSTLMKKYGTPRVEKKTVAKTPVKAKTVKKETKKTVAKKPTVKKTSK